MKSNHLRILLPVVGIFLISLAFSVLLQVGQRKENTENKAGNRNDHSGFYNWKVLARKIKNQAKIESEDATEYNEYNTVCNESWIKIAYSSDDWPEGIAHNTIHAYLKNKKEILAFITFGPFSESQNDTIRDILDEDSFRYCKVVSYLNKQVAYRCGDLFISQFNNFSDKDLDATFSRYEIPDDNLLEWSKNSAFLLLSKPDYFSYSSKKPFCIGYGCRYSILVIYSSTFILNDFMKEIEPHYLRKTANVPEKFDAHWPGFEFIEDAEKVYIPRVQCFEQL